MPLDANGIHQFTGTESGLKSMLNTLASSVSTKVGELVASVLLASIAELDGKKSAGSPPAGTRLRVKLGRRAYTSVAGGVYLVTFGTAFPNGIGGALAWPQAGSTSLVGNSDSTMATSGFQVVVPGQAAGVNMVIYFIAWGW